MLRGEALARYVNAQVGNRLIEQMPLPLGIVATDLNTGQGVLFQRGDTGTAVRASSAVPAVFLPVKIGRQEYVDGGLVVAGARALCAADGRRGRDRRRHLGRPGGQLGFGDSLQMLLQTFAIMGKSINAGSCSDADIVVRPALVGMGSADFASKRRAIEAGRARHAAPAATAAGGDGSEEPMGRT